MQLSGTHTAKATSAKVWQVLMNTNTLARIIPGISKLEKTGENSYKSFSEIKLGPINSTFSGNLQMENIDTEKGFTLKVQQNSKMGNASASIKIGLSNLIENAVEVNFDGEVKLSGLMATMGNRVVGSISNTLTRQFFENLDRELSVQSG
ncbi:MAG: carbon monoxide dehydrogenase subunit G [Bacteroidota bacterium]|nr:carbon monoxide dehydrogenase subunit G [Bacteroidota bacterium]